MDEKPSFRPFLVPMLLLLVGGWSGLALILNFSLPTLWPRWAFFALIVVAFTGTALPVSFLLNQRLMSNGVGVVTRQATWVGIYFAILAWLQIGHILNFSVALWFVLGFIAVEYLIQLRERAGKTKNEG
jgi:predicted membrane channel-forming protein YqfA (hemolysin III family)